MTVKKRYDRSNPMKKTLLISILMGYLGICLILNFALAEPSVTLKLKRNNGTDMGDNLRIEGDWTITGTGSNDIVRIDLLFNANITSHSDNNLLSFRFNTREYAIGTTNITLIGYLSDGISVQTTEIREFMDPAETDRFLAITLSIAGGIVVLSIVIAIISKKKQNSQPKPTKRDVEIGEL